MAMALLTISSLSQPVRALGRWFSRNLSTSGNQLHQTHPPAPRASGITNEPRAMASPLQGLWVASPGTCVSAEGNSRVAANAERFDVIPVATLRPAAPQHRTVRVVRHTDGGGPSRFLISGRMADVCAELDRLAAREAALQ